MRKLNKSSSKKAVFQSPMKPLGILGGGQLARMLALRASALGIPVTVLSESERDPAAQVTSLWRKGSLKSETDLAMFLKTCAVATFESEFLDAEILAKLSKSTKTPIFPRPEHMAILQDRWTQKNLLLEHQLKTSPFIRVDDTDDAQDAYLEFNGQLVFKKRRFGYDGNGTYIIRSLKEFEKFAAGFDKAAGEAGFIAEKYIPFEREVAVMIARSNSGQTVTLPFVESFQENSRCLWVKGPLKSSARFATLENALLRFLDKTHYVGVMGIELFETSTGELLVNELAPRVHNSGHYSMDAMSEDQFSLHLKSVMGAEIETPNLLAPGFAMYNLLGHSTRAPKWTLAPDVKLHWYGKCENRPGRKMGHLNILAKTAESKARAKTGTRLSAKTSRKQSVLKAAVQSAPDAALARAKFAIRDFEL